MSNNNPGTEGETLHIISIEEIDGPNDSWNEPEPQSVQEKHRFFTDLFKNVPSKELLEIKESLRMQKFEAKESNAPFEVREDIFIKIHVIDNILGDRPRFSVLVEKLSYDASGAEERLHNLPTTRTVDLYIDMLERDFNICIPDEDSSASYPIISSKEKIDKILNLTFYWGQNDFQSKDVPSVSVGDVIHLKGRYYRVASIGFEPLTVGEYASYKEIPSRDRTWDKWREAIKS